MEKKVKIKCPYCLMHNDEEVILREDGILEHMSSWHDRDSESLENTISSFKQLGLWFEVEE